MIKMSREAGLKKQLEQFIKRFGLPPSAVFPKMRKARSDKGKHIGYHLNENTGKLER
jgi:hypothetical protein